MLTVPVHCEHVGLQLTHSLFIVISLEFRHDALQVKLVVSTRLLIQEVQVSVVPAHVNQFGSQASQLFPLRIVFPTSHVDTHVSVLSSNLIFEVHDLHVEVVPEQVRQFESHSVQVNAVES